MKYDPGDQLQARILQLARARIPAARSGTLGFLGDNSAIADQIQTAASAAGIPPSLALQVAQSESGLSNSAVSGKGAIGIFQLMPATAAQLGVDPTDPTQNIQGGIAYLAQLFQQFGDWATALAAYNWGPGNVAKYGAAAAPSSTQNYVSTILANSGPTAQASPNGSSNSAPLVPYDPSQDTGDIIDLPGLVTSTADTGPNWGLLAILGLGAYIVLDVFRG